MGHRFSGRITEGLRATIAFNSPRGELASGTTVVPVNVAVADFVTLREGGVTLYHADTVLSEDLEWFRLAGYAVVEFDGAKWRSTDVLFESFAAELRFPSHFGFNLDAFSECLSEDSQVPKQGLVVVIRRIDSAVRYLGQAFVLDAIDVLCLASHEQLLYGRRLMFLLQSADPRIELRTVGARPVSWNSREFLYSSRGIE